MIKFSIFRLSAPLTRLEIQNSNVFTFLCASPLCPHPLLLHPLITSLLPPLLLLPLITSLLLTLFLNFLLFTSLFPAVSLSLTLYFPSFPSLQFPYHPLFTFLIPSPLLSNSLLPFSPSPLTNLAFFTSFHSHLLFLLLFSPISHS